MFWPTGRSGGGISDPRQGAGPAWGGGSQSLYTSEDRSKDGGLLQKHRVCLRQRKESEVEQGGAESEESVEQQ